MAYNNFMININGLCNIYNCLFYSPIQAKKNVGIESIYRIDVDNYVKKLPDEASGGFK
jgi:hypothetical protein